MVYTVAALQLAALRGTSTPPPTQCTTATAPPVVVVFVKFPGASKLKTVLVEDGRLETLVSILERDALFGTHDDTWLLHNGHAGVLMPFDTIHIMARVRGGSQGRPSPRAQIDRYYHNLLTGGPRRRRRPSTTPSPSGSLSSTSSSSLSPPAPGSISAGPSSSSSSAGQHSPEDASDARVLAGWPTPQCSEPVHSSTSPTSSPSSSSLEVGDSSSSECVAPHQYSRRQRHCRFVDAEATRAGDSSGGDESEVVAPNNTTLTFARTTSTVAVTSLTKAQQNRFD